MVCVIDNLFKKTVFQLLHITQKGKRFPFYGNASLLQYAYKSLISLYICSHLYDFININSAIYVQLHDFNYISSFL